MSLHCSACNAPLPSGHRGSCPACGVRHPTSTVLQPARAEQHDSTVDIGAAVNPPSAATLNLRDPLIGGQIAGCVVLERLGQGGMGRVYRAHHQGLGRMVAVKVLNGDLVANATFVERFLREARSAAQLDHPNVVRILNAGEDTGHRFIVMEFVEGETLSARLRRLGRLEMAETLRIAAGIAHALACAHELGLVHRDIKPDNIMFTADDAVKVADFGLARNVAARQDLTAEGLACGTPPYMSPEQISGQQVDGRSDLYSLGVLLYESLAGKRPFNADNLLGWLECHTQREPEPLRRHAPDVPDDLAEVVARLLAKRPEDRYADARELLGDLQFLGANEAPREGTRRSTRHDLAPGGSKRLFTLLGQGIDEGALSLHIEPAPGGGGRVRLRVRGQLTEVERLSAGAFRQMVDACRSAAGHAQAGEEGPLEGVVDFEHNRQRRQAKLSIVPTSHGPRAALRLMGLVKPHNQLVQQGFAAPHVRQWRDWLAEGPGVVAVAGPAGSGKGQTVGGLLGLVDLSNVLSIAIAEESHVDSEEISQLQVDHRTSRQDALRLALRQYPDLVLLLDVHGIADRGTAHEAFQAATTGRRILASLMWEDAAETIEGFLAFGVDHKTLARTLRGVISPRLVRLTCPGCREVYTPEVSMLLRLGLGDQDGPFFRTRGCERCKGGTHRPRTVVYESFAPTPEFWAELGEETQEGAIAKVTTSHGLVSMRDMVLARVRKGFIDPEHALAVLPPSYLRTAG